MSSYVSGHGRFRGVYGRDGTRFRNRCQYLTFAYFLSVRWRSSGATANRCENCLHQMIALAKAAGSVPAGSVVPEGAIGRLETPHLDRTLDVVVGTGRQVDVQVRPVPDRERIQAERVGARRRLDDRGGPPAEVEVVGTVEGAAGETARDDRGRSRRGRACRDLRARYRRRLGRRRAAGWSGRRDRRRGWIDDRDRCSGSMSSVRIHSGDADVVAERQGDRQTDDQEDPRPCADVGEPPRTSRAAMRPGQHRQRTRRRRGRPTSRYV